MVSQNVVYAYELAEKNTNNNFEDEINFENIDLDSLKDLDIEFPKLEDYTDIESGNSDLDKGVIIDLLRKTRSLQDLEGTISYELEDEINKEVKVQDDNNDSNYKIIDSQRRIYSSEEKVPFVFTSKVEDDIVNPYFIYVQDLKDGQSVEITISDETGQVYSTQMDSYTKEIDLSFIEKNKEYTVYVNSLYEDNVVAEVSNIGEIKGNAKITKTYVCDYICEMEEDSNRIINDIWNIATNTSIKSEKVEEILNDLEEKNKENKNEEETVVDHVYGRVNKDIDRVNFEDESLEITYYLDEEEYSTRTSRRRSRRGYKTSFEDEPNDDFDDANPIFNGESIEAVIEEDDEDYFKIIFPKDGYANFWIGNIPSGKDYELEVFDNDDESDEIKWHYAEGRHPDIQFRTLRAVRVRANREYFVKVQGRFGNDYDDNDEYELRAKVYSSPDIEEDEYEDNNDFRDATDDVFDNMRIGSKTSIEANIHSNTRRFEDEDYYELELKEECGIRIYLDDIQKGCDYDLTLYDENEDRIVRSNLSDDDDEELEGVLQAGKYYIKIDAARGHSSYPYELSCEAYRVSDMRDQCEFNDDEDYAYQLTANQSVKGTLLNEDDEDYFKFKLDSDSKVTIKLEDVPDGEDYQFRLLDEDCDKIEIVDEDGNGDNEELTIDLDRGIYYIMVEGDHDDDYDDDEQYKIGYYLDEQPQIPIESGIKLNIKYDEKEMTSIYFINMNLSSDKKTLEYTNNTIILFERAGKTVGRLLNGDGEVKKKLTDTMVNFIKKYVLDNIRNSKGRVSRLADFPLEWAVIDIDGKKIEKAIWDYIDSHKKQIVVDSGLVNENFYEEHKELITEGMKGAFKECIKRAVYEAILIVLPLGEYESKDEDREYPYYVGKVSLEIAFIVAAKRQTEVIDNYRQKGREFLVNCFGEKVVEFFEYEPPKYLEEEYSIDIVTKLMPTLPAAENATPSLALAEGGAIGGGILAAIEGSIIVEAAAVVAVGTAVGIATVQYAGHLASENIAKDELLLKASKTTFEGTSNLWKNVDLLDELASSGVKYSPDDVLAVTKTGNGKLAWLETGNSKAGMQHILNHADDFAKKGIQQDQILDLVMESLTNGKIVGYQGRGTGRPIYEVMFNGNKHHTAITVGGNGFIVGANPTTWP
jgi:hypothetical protein